MSNNLTFGLSSVIQRVQENFSGGQRNTENRETYGRVLRTILSKDDEGWETYGKDQALYGVFYVPLTEDLAEYPDIKFAYCGISNIRTIPVKNEIVKLEFQFAADYSDQEFSQDSQKVYWTGIIPVWNSPHLNVYPNQVKFEGKEADTGDFLEKGEIKPLYLTDGDLSIEGRHGHSIKFGGSFNRSNNIKGEISNEQNTGSPFIIIRNGQSDLNSISEDYKEVTGAFTHSVLENINTDDCSVYLTSNHNIDLVEASTKSKGYGPNNVPEECKNYSEPQIVCSSDRIILNARKHDIKILSKESIKISSDILSLDGVNSIGMDASKIYLGEKSFTEKEHNLKGDTVVEWLSKICDQLQNLMTIMSTPVADPKVYNGMLVSQAVQVKASIIELKSKLNTLLSNKIFVE